MRTSAKLTVLLCTRIRYACPDATDVTVLCSLRNRVVYCATDLLAPSILHYSCSKARRLIRCVKHGEATPSDTRSAAS